MLETPVQVTETPGQTPETPNSRRKRLARESYKKNKIIKHKTPVIEMSTLQRAPTPHRQVTHDQGVWRDAFRLSLRRSGFV